MKKLLYALLLALLLQMGGATAQSIRLRLPDTTALVGSSFLLPVYADSSFTGLNVISYQVQLNYTASHLLADSLVSTGTLSAGASPIANFGSSGSVTVAAASAMPLSGTGVLFYIRFRVVSSTGGYSSTVGFSSATNTYLNQGSPVLTFRNGTITVPSLPSITVNPASGTLVVGDTLQFSATGGRQPYSWRLTDSTRGSITALSTTAARFIAATAGSTRVVATDSNGFSGQSSQDLVVHNVRMWTRDSSKLQGTELLLPIYVSSLNAWNVLSGSFEVQLANYPGLTLVGIERSGTLLSAVNQTFFAARANNIWEVSFANATAITGSGILCYLRISIPNLYSYNYTYAVSLIDVLFNQNLTALTSSSTQTAVALPQINISPNTAAIVAGESRQFIASNGFAPYRWSVSDTALATISSSGLLTALQGGIVTLTATDTVNARRTSGNITLYDTRVYIRDTVLITGDTLVDVAVYMDALPPGKSITALSMAFDYNNSFWRPDQVIQAGTATAAWASAVNNIGNNRFSIALAGTNPQVGAGTLFYIRFKVLPGFTVNNSTSLTNIQLVMNEGNPNYLLENGQIRSLPCNPTATVSPAGNVSFCANQPIQLTGSSGTAFQYQWSRNGLPVAGATNRLFTPTQSGHYTLRVSLNSSCSVVSDTVYVTINVSPIAQIIPYADTLHSCSGDTVLLRAFASPGYSYQWFRNGATISSATDTFLRVVQNGEYTVRTTINGCQTTSVAQIVDFKALPAKPVIAVLGSPVCAGDSATLSIPAMTGQIQWFNVTGAISGATDTVLRAGPGKYVVRITGAFGCFIYADSITVTQVTASAQISPSGSTSFCEGGVVSLNLTQPTTYVRWFRNGLQLPDTIRPLQVSVSGSYTANYRLVGNSCVFSTSAVQISVTPRPVVTLDSLAAVCANSADFLLTGGLPLGGTYVGPGVVNNRFFTASLASGTYTIKYGVQVNGCSDTASRLITILPLPGTSFPQPAGVCINAAPFALSGGLPAGGTYFGVGVTGGLFNPASAGIGTHTVGYTTQNANACTDTVFRSISVSALPEASIVQGTQVVLCAGGSVALNATSTTGMSYVWLRNGAVLVGQTSANITATLSGNYRVIVTNNATQCFDTSVATIVTVNVLPVASISAAGATTFCAGGSVILNATPATGVSYVWLRNGLVVAGQIAESITATQSGAYRVIVTSASTQCSDTSAVTSVTVNALPEAAIIQAGATTFCTGGSVLLNAAPATGVSYVWLKDGLAQTTATSSSFTASASGSYRVVITNSNGCSDTSAVVSVTVFPQPQAGLTASGATSFCLGGSVLLNAAPATGVTYTWLKDGVVISGAASSSFTANQSGNYQVIVTTANGCSDTSSSVTITVQVCGYIVGSVNYLNQANTPMTNTQVTLLNQQQQTIAQTTTNVNGGFSFSNTGNGQFQLQLTTNKPWGGVNATDALAAARHFTGLNVQTGLRLKAADVNASNNVNATDALQIGRRFTGQLGSFVAGNWAFDMPSIVVNNDTVQLQLGALAYGDINGSYLPDVQLRMGNEVLLAKQGFAEMQKMRWPIQAAQAFETGAISLVLTLPAGIEVHGVQMPASSTTAEFSQKGHELRISWFSLQPMSLQAGATLFELQFTGTALDATAELALAAGCEIADGWAEPLQQVRLQAPILRDHHRMGLQASNYPNPFSSSTTLEMSLPEAGEVQLRITDSRGRLVLQWPLQQFEAGNHRLQLPSESWQDGSYHCELLYSTAERSERKLLRLLKQQ